MSGLLRRPFTRVLATRGVHTEARIAKLGYTLPTLPQPVGAYTLAVKQGGWVYCAGHLPFKGEGVSHARRLNLSLALTATFMPSHNYTENMKDLHIGRLGVEFTAEQGSELAKITGLELIASLKGAVGDLDKVKRIVKVNGYIACPDTFTALPAVLNGCSNLIGEVFEDRGVHARAAVGVTSLPLGVPVEIDLVAEVED